MGQTLAEKILSKHCGKTVHAGDFILADLDLVMAHDTTCAWALEPFYQIAKKVFDPKKIFIPFDHAFPSPSVAMSKLQAEIRKFAEEQGIPISFEGVCHQVMSERLINPGNLILGADSHSPTGGGVGALTIGVGSTDAAIAMATGKAWFRVPQAIRINIRNTAARLFKGCCSHGAREMGADGANYQAIVCGETVEGFNVPARLTLTNMSAEMGAKAAIVAPDEQTAAYLQENDRLFEFEALRSDASAHFERVLNFDVSRLKPMIACPPDIDNDVPVEDVQAQRVVVDQVFIGSCTNCRIDDLEVVYRMWKGRQLKEGLRTIVTPASRKVYMQALQRGYIEEFVKMGAIVSSPGCGPCQPSCVCYTTTRFASPPATHLKVAWAAPKRKFIWPARQLLRL
jgi:homoaconitase/3-isopropylmalate dehydratase large subunit